MSDEVIETDIASIFGPDAIRRVDAELRWEQPKEKLRHYQIAAARIKAEQSVTKIKKHVDGLGQHHLSIPVRTYFRWKQIDPHFWLDKKNRDNFYRDNPECRADV